MLMYKNEAFERNAVAKAATLRSEQKRPKARIGTMLERSYASTLSEKGKGMKGRESGKRAKEERQRHSDGQTEK